MDYKDKTLCRVRTITTFLVLDKDRATWKKEISAATRFCNELALAFVEGGTVFNPSVSLPTRSGNTWTQRMGLPRKRTWLSSASS